MSESLKTDLNLLTNRITMLEISQGQHSTRLDQHDKNFDFIWESNKEVRKLLQSQGIRLAIIFGGINVVVVGVGLLVGFASLLEKLKHLGN